jgi:transposase
MYPLLTNDTALGAAQVLPAHKGQPRIEKRSEPLETLHEIAPVFLENEARIEGLFTLHFVALLVQGLIERQLRVAMHAAGIEALPLYPEARVCRRPTTEQILRLFSLCERITISAGGEVVSVVAPTLTSLQRQLLELLGVPGATYLG